MANIRHSSDAQGELKTSIDSFSIRIPLDLVQIHDYRLLENPKQVYLSTGEIAPDEKPKRGYSYTLKLDGYRCSFKVKSSVIGYDKERQSKMYADFLCIGVHSKLLHSQYFEGIRKDNIQLIYDRLQSFGIVSFSYDSFLSGLVSDVDIKRDSKVDRLSDRVKVVSKCVRPSADKYARKFKPSQGGGLQFAERSKATNSRPFLKIYDKSKDLSENGSSEDFALTYLKGQDLSNIVRLEGTLKTFEMANKYGADLADNSLSSWLDLDADLLSLVLNNLVRVYIEAPVLKRRKNLTSLSPLDLFFLRSLEIALSKELSLTYAIDSLTIDFDRKVKSRYRKKLLDLFKDHIQDTPVGVEVNRNDQILTLLGL